MKPFLTLLLTFLFVNITFSQNYWGKHTTSDFTNEALAIQTDPSGFSYVCGYLTGETTFSSTVNFNSAQGNGDIYVAKYNPSGGLVWVKKFGGNYSDRAFDLDLDQNGNIFVTGQFFGNVQFGNQSITSSNNSKDIFLLKLNPNGDIIWAIAQGGNGEENAYGLTCDNSGNIILTGQFKGASVIANQTLSSTIDPTTNQQEFDLFISKYDQNGNPLWVKNGQAKYEDRGLAVSTDNQNNIYLCGQFSDTLLIDNLLLNNNAYNVGLLLKLNPNGNVIWHNTLRSSMVVPYDIEVKGNDVLVTGDCGNYLIYSNNGSNYQHTSSYQKNIFLLKTNLEGSKNWISSLGSDNIVSARDLIMDNSNQIYVTGYFTCAWTQFHQPQSAYYNAVGHKDAYLWKTNSAGTHQFLKTFGGKEDDIGQGIAIGQNQEPIICGSYTQSLNIPYNLSQSYEINAFQSLSYITNEPFFYLQGDHSRNSFILNAIGDFSPDYNYFFNQTSDSLLSSINNYLDTIHVCTDTTLYALTYTYNHAGPAYNYLWNTNETTSQIQITSSGIYSVNIERNDLCSVDQDSIVVIVHDLPDLPIMSDNLGLAINEIGPHYYNYNFCYPDSVQIWFNQLQPYTSISLMNISQNYSDSLPHYITSTSLVTISNQYCSNYGHVYIDFDYEEEKDFKPYVKLIDHHQQVYTDSLTICQNESFQLQCLDSINNPTAIFGLVPNLELVQLLFTVSNNGVSQTQTSSSFYTSSFYPSVSGMYYVEVFAISGYQNLCGVDTLHHTVLDSFYIEVLPSPQINIPTIFGDNLLCPDGSLIFTVDNTYPGLTWTGNGITWISNDHDSIQVQSAGHVYYSGIVTEPQTGCSTLVETNLQIIEKIPPIISADPTDLIVCPYDSVFLQIPDTFVSYNWIGPSGSNLSNSFEHADDELGFYYVVAEDQDGCFLTSAPVELVEFSSPHLSVEPDWILCNNESTTIQVEIVGDGVYTWIHPQNHNATTLTVNQPGWYICQLTQCGVTNTDSIQIVDGSFEIEITNSDSILCFGNNFVLEATPGLNNYTWNNIAGSSALSTNEEGIYQVSATNNYGCQATSESFTIYESSGSQPPSDQTITVCTVGLTNIEYDESIFWYNLDSSGISVGNSMPVNIQSDTTFLISFEPTSSCPLQFGFYHIDLIQEQPDFSLSGDSTLCYNQPLILSIESSNLDWEWFNNMNSLGSSDTINLIYSNLSSSSIEIHLSNACFDTVIHPTFTFLPTNHISILEDSIITCPNETIILHIEEDYTNIFWVIEQDTIQVNSLEHENSNPQSIYVFAQDENGCFTTRDSIYVYSPDFHTQIVNQQTIYCSGDSVLLTAQTDLDSLIWTSSWLNSTQTSVEFEMNESKEGFYYLTTVDSLGCIYMDSVFLTNNQFAVNPLPSDTIVCVGYPIQFETNFSGLTLNWLNEDPTDGVNQSEWFLVEINNGTGCSLVDSIFIGTVNCTDQIPNVFTPNGDGINDYFLIDEAPLFPNNELIIYNRWGTIVHESNPYNNLFSGENLSEGVYFYVFTYDKQNPAQKRSEGFFEIKR